MNTDMIKDEFEETEMDEFEDFEEDGLKIDPKKVIGVVAGGGAIAGGVYIVKRYGAAIKDAVAEKHAEIFAEKEAKRAAKKAEKEAKKLEETK